jgi:hypothetical protein
MAVLGYRAMLDRFPIFTHYAKLSFEPNAWIIPTYAFFCSLHYSSVVQVDGIVQLYRLLFHFPPLQVIAWVPSGFTNYPFAILWSIMEGISPRLDAQTVLFSIGIPILSNVNRVRDHVLRNVPPVYFNQMSRRTLRYGKRLVFLSLLVYTLLYSTAITIHQYRIIVTSNQNPVETGIGKECLEMVLVHVNGTVQQSALCSSSNHTPPLGQGLAAKLNFQIVT